MTTPRAIAGDFADIKTVKTRSVVQVIVECPIEEGESIIRMLGFPQPGNPKRVALALLVDNVVKLEKPRGERSWSEMSLAQQAGIRCNEPAFWTFLREIGESSCIDAAAAAAYVRLACGGLHSRSELDKNSAAARKWRDMDRSYSAWLQAAEVV